MSFTTTYTSLTAQLQAFLEEDGAELVASIPDLIGLGELRLLRDLRLEMFDSYDETITGASGSQFVTKPTGWVFTRQLWYDNGAGKFVPLDERSPSYVNSYWPTATAYGTPKFVAEYSTGSWQVVPTPSSALGFKAHFHSRPDGLSSGNESTYLSNAAPDALLYACLAESEKFLIGDERVAVWLNTYGDRLSSARIELRRLERDDYTPVGTAAQATDED